MRKLTIKRKKSFVGCLAKMKIYVQDDNSNEIEINGVKCRKIGSVKNGEEKSFEIGEEATRVYVIADSLSKSYCNEFYPIDAGTEDVYLSGKNTLPVRGNPFRFDNQTDPEAIENRRKGKGKAVTVIVIAAIVGFVIGFLVVSLSL